MPKQDIYPDEHYDPLTLVWGIASYAGLLIAHKLANHFAPWLHIAGAALGLLLVASGVTWLYGRGGQRAQTAGVVALWFGYLPHLRGPLQWLGASVLLLAVVFLIGWEGWASDEALRRRELYYARLSTPAFLERVGVAPGATLIAQNVTPRRWVRVFQLPDRANVTPNMEKVKENAAQLYHRAGAIVNAHLLPSNLSRFVLTVASSAPWEGTPPPLPAPTTWRKAHQPLGWDPDMRVRWLDLGTKEGLHMLIAGLPGSGKSNTAHVVVYGRHVLRHDLAIVDAAKRGSEFADWEPHAKWWAEDWGQTMRLMKDLLRVLSERWDLMRARKWRHWKGTPITLVVDEAHSVLRIPEVAEAVFTLMSEGRAAGFMVVLIEQNPTNAIFKGPFKSFVNIQIVHQVRSVTESNVALGNGSKGKGWDASTIDVQGRAIADLPRRDWLQVFPAPAAPGGRTVPFRATFHESDQVGDIATDARGTERIASSDAAVAGRELPTAERLPPLPLVTTPVEDVRVWRSDWCRAALAALMDAAEPIGPTALGVVIGAPKSSALRALEELGDAGLARKVGDKWVAVDAPNAT